MSEIGSHKRIAKNTIALYVRGLISVIIGLFTSREVFNMLGVDNYGVLGVAGGFIGFLGFLNASMSGATSRFITYSIGLGNYENTRNTFANALTVHILIAGMVLIICEAIGSWFLNTQLNIPKDRMTAANVVFQLSILSTCISITQVPYSALIISHEKMGIYAYMETANVILKLVIVYFLLVIPGDKLIVYSILTTVVSVIIAMAYRIYCIKNFQESHTMPKYSKKLLKPMLSFSGWDLYGNLSVTARNQGTTYLLNIFFGVAINGAASLATVINGILVSFSQNITMAFRPQIIKNYAQNAFEQFQRLITLSSQLSCIMLTMMAIPLILETPYIFGLWLGEVPAWVVPFSRITIISSIIGQNTNPITIGINATGKIKRLSLLTGTIILLTLPIIWIVLKLGGTPLSAFIVSMIMIFIIFLVNVANLKHNMVQFDARKYLKKVAQIPFIILPAAIGCYIVHYYMDIKFLRFITICVVSIILICFSTFIFVLDKQQRMKIIYMISKRKS